MCSGGKVIGAGIGDGRQVDDVAVENLLISDGKRRNRGVINVHVNKVKT